MLSIAESRRNNALNDLRNGIDQGAGDGILSIYDGTRPASGGTVTTLLVQNTFSTISAPNAVSGISTYNPLTSGVAVATGTATWARVTDSDLNFVIDMDIDQLNLNDVNIITSGTLAVDSFALTAGNA